MLCIIVHCFVQHSKNHLVRVKSIPAANDTRWQIEAITEMEQAKLSDVLRHETSHTNLILKTKEVAQLQKMVSLLAPFAEATVTISCVVPTVLTLWRLLIEQQPSVTYHRSAVDELLRQIDTRFYDLLHSGRRWEHHCLGITCWLLIRIRSQQTQPSSWKGNFTATLTL